MKRVLLGVLIGVILGWLTVPIVSARRFSSYMDAIERAVDLLEQIEINTRKG